MSFNNLEWTYWLCVQSNAIFVIIIIQQIFVDMCQRILTHPEAVDCFSYPIRKKLKEGYKRTRFYP